MMRWALSLACLACTSQCSICKNLIQKIHGQIQAIAHRLTSTFWWILLKSCFEILFFIYKYFHPEGLEQVKKMSLLSMIKVKKTSADIYLITFGWLVILIPEKLNQIFKKWSQYLPDLIFTVSKYSRKSHSFVNMMYQVVEFSNIGQYYPFLPVGKSNCRNIGLLIH